MTFSCSFVGGAVHEPSAHMAFFSTVSVVVSQRHQWVWHAYHSIFSVLETKPSLRGQELPAVERVCEDVSFNQWFHSHFGSWDFLIAHPVYLNQLMLFLSWLRDDL